MALDVGWIELIGRLMLAGIAGALLGLNREQRGHAAGFRTTILVALAAAIAMEQADLLLPADGKTAGSFGVIDVGRWPLGILTGVGFIGAGTIMRRGSPVTGITTAATLWIATILGLVFGGGQIALGVIGTAFAVLVLWTLRSVDDFIPRKRRAAPLPEPAHRDTVRRRPARLELRHRMARPRRRYLRPRSPCRPQSEERAAILPAGAGSGALEAVRNGAGSGNRTRIFSLEGCCSTTELYPRCLSPNRSGPEQSTRQLG
jgi:putative Mg2+ transporter-C (MgtC) family protein